VHARGQVTHADVDVAPDVDDLSRRLDGLLPSDIRVRSVVAAPARQGRAPSRAG